MVIIRRPPHLWQSFFFKSGSTCKNNEGPSSVKQFLLETKKLFKINVSFDSLSSLGGKLTYSDNYSSICPFDFFFLLRATRSLSVSGAKILSEVRFHVPHIKLLMKYLLGLQAQQQPSPKPPLSPGNISKWRLVPPLRGRSIFPI